MASGPITLVPATLKEASLDSPTFRGTVIHFAEQVELVEKWLDGFIEASLRLVNDVLALEEPINNFLARTVPGNISESVVDHDYTLLAMQRYAEGSKGFWMNAILGARRVQNNLITPMITFQCNEVGRFKTKRRLLEVAQTKYDALLTRYLSQSKSKEPSALREVAFQLYEARRAYSKICFDFCIAAPAFRTDLDRLLTKVISNQWRDQIGLQKDMAGLVERCSSDIERIRSCYASMEVNESVFLKQLTTARVELERRAKNEYQPARELDEYSSSTVPYLTSRPPAVIEGEEVPKEKQGWLFMRTLAGKPTRSLWIRRWFFIKAGIFGWLVQGYRGGGAEESEKVGVLLCNIKPAFQEERRFCFEVKTKDTTILLQTETQADLTTWMAVFEQAKRAAVESSSLVASSQAFSIIPPSAPAPPAEPAYVTRGHDGNSASSVVPPDGLSLLPRTLRRDGDNQGHGFERAVTLGPGAGGAFPRATSMDANRGTPEPSTPIKSDHRKASSTIGNISPVGMGSSPVGISALIAASHNLLPISPDPAKQPTMTLPEVHVPKVSSLAPNTLSSTPSPVNLLLAATVTSGSGITGIAERSPVTAPEKGHRKTMSLDVGGHKGDATSGEFEYFPGYPMALRVQDEHFRMLFPGTHAHVMQLVFRAIWSPNDTQELPGRCFVTDQNLYFYSHYLGLVFTSTTPLSTITEVKAAPGKDCDYLFLHLNTDVDGEKPLITIKTFLEPLRLLHRRLDLMVKNAQPKAEVEGTKLNSQKLLQQLIELGEEMESKGSDDMSWEDVGRYIDGCGDEPLNRRRGAPEGFKLRLDHDGNRAFDEKAREARLKLPSAPVVYHPPGMSRKSLEREFEIPPRALFHVLFGDKSTVFQTMYAQRRAQPIQQGPWKELDKGKARRQFAYHLAFVDIFGRNRRADIVDHQTIEKQDEHICYVITDVKTPWNLSHRMNFIMVSKIVITHVTASKSKLTVWTRVDWFKDPMFSKSIVQQQAQEDLDNDALDLGDVVAEAIHKLGKSPNVPTAMEIFGGTNGQTIIPATPSAGPTTGTQPKQGTDSPPNPIHAPRIPIKRHSLSQMLLENTLSLSESVVSSAIMSIVAVVKGVAGLVSVHWVLLALLGFSVLTNTALSTRAGMAYWSERRAHALLESISAAPDGTMVRAIALSDLELAVAPPENITHPSSGMCWNKFLSHSTAGDRAMGQRIHTGRETLGRYRHDLVVAVRVVNALERELMKAEWERWVYGELEKCRFAAKILGSMDGVEGLQGVGGLEEYCGDCQQVKGMGII